MTRGRARFTPVTCPRPAPRAPHRGLRCARAVRPARARALRAAPRPAHAARRAADGGFRAPRCAKRWSASARGARCLYARGRAVQCVGFVAVGREGPRRPRPRRSNEARARPRSTASRSRTLYVRGSASPRRRAPCPARRARQRREAAVLTLADAPLVPPPTTTARHPPPRRSSAARARRPRRGGPRPRGASAVEHPPAPSTRPHRPRVLPRRRPAQRPAPRQTNQNPVPRCGALPCDPGAGGDHVDDLDLRSSAPTAAPRARTSAPTRARSCACALAGRRAPLGRPADVLGPGREGLRGNLEVPADAPQRLGDDVKRGRRCARALEVMMEAAGVGSAPRGRRGARRRGSARRFLLGR